MPIKSVEMKIAKKKKKMCFLLISQGSFNTKIRFLDQKVCSIARRQTHTHTKVNKEDNLSGFQELFLQPIIKDRSNMLISFKYFQGSLSLLKRNHFRLTRKC